MALCHRPSADRETIYDHKKHSFLDTFILSTQECKFFSDLSMISDLFNFDTSENYF